MGMTISFARLKTALLLPAWVQGTPDCPVQLNVTGQRYVPIADSLTELEHELLLVESYKHLGGIIVSNTSPVPDLHHRHARAAAVVRPLHRRLFACKQVPLTTRRMLLQSLALSKYVHTGASLILPAAFHRRLWAQHYVGLWRSLFVRLQTDRSAHSYDVLLAARAPSPPLALAKARAAFMKRLSMRGPSLLGRLLYDHWATFPANSWLGQLQGDVKQVLLYVPEVSGVLGCGDPVPNLLDAYLEDPSWWPKQVTKAVKAFQADLRRWKESGPAQPLVSLAPPTPVELPYRCAECGAAFPLRKHLGVHLARAHGVLAPSRHFAPHTFCVSCHRDYGAVKRVQMHLKGADACLRRAARVIAPLTKEQIVEAEAPDRAKLKRQKGGQWMDFKAPAPASVVLGPVLPLWEERRPCLSLPEDEVMISQLCPAFVPLQTTLDWVEEHISQRSTEGPRSTSSSFWDQRPCFTTA